MKPIDSTTTDRIVEWLIEASGPVSGTLLARRLGISRTAVWKAVHKLIQDGYSIQRIPRQGYRLIKVPDRLLPSLIRSRMGSCCLTASIHHFDTVDSTNRIAKELAGRGAGDGTLVLAEMQTRGRGRLDRRWVSPKGRNLLFSLVLRPPLAPHEVFRLNMVASVSLVQAVARVTELQSEIKWPNDLYLGGRKLAGILTEFSATADKLEHAVVGIGLNVNMDPVEFSDLTGIATSIRAELGRPVSRLELLSEILLHLNRWYDRLIRGQDKDLRDLWLRHSMIIGREVEVLSFGKIVRGRAETIDEDGALVLLDEDGRKQKLVCGDVSLQRIS